LSPVVGFGYAATLMLTGALVLLFLDPTKGEKR
jgi:hypothetical protein